MSGPLSPGDRVVCVNASKCPVYPDVAHYQLGAIYTITEAQDFTDGNTGVSAFCVRTDRHNPVRNGVMGWSRHERFRPIRPNEEAAHRTWAALLNEPAPAKPSLNPEPVLPLSSAGGK